MIIMEDQTNENNMKKNKTGKELWGKEPKTVRENKYYKSVSIGVLYNILFVAEGSLSKLKTNT